MLGSGRELRKRVPKNYEAADEEEPARDEAKPRKRGRPLKEDRRSSAVRIPKRAAPPKLKPFPAPCGAAKLESWRNSFEQLPDDLRLQELPGAADGEDTHGLEDVAHANGEPGQSADSCTFSMPPPRKSDSARPLPVPMPPAASAQLMQVGPGGSALSGGSTMATGLGCPGPSPRPPHAWAPPHTPSPPGVGVLLPPLLR